ncbi:MAG: 2TM domain-containing protein, partial [Candidatus Nanopelagicales bacterium]
MSDDAARQQAIQRLHQRRGFMNYVIGAVVISLFMVVIWALSGQGYFWPIWVMGGFLIGGIFYGVNNVMNR